jgi:hypothetical protein
MQSISSPAPHVKPRSRKPLAPVSVAGVLITGLDTGLADLFEGCAILEIEDAKELTSYWCGASTDDQGRITSLHLRKFATGEQYELPADLSSCNCPDSTYRSERPGGCRHQVALRQALLVASASLAARPAA